MMATSAVITPARNERCPCGSDKRYKDCCGSIGAAAPATASRSLTDLMNSALAAQHARRLDEAELLYREALSRSPDNPDALHMLGVIRYEKRDDAQAQSLILRALDLTHWAHRAYRHNLGLVLARIGRSQDEGDRSASARARQREWLSSHEPRPPVTPPSVDVVIPCFNHGRFVEAALRSVFAQTFRDLCITVIDDGSSDDSTSVIARVLRDSPFPHRFVARGNRGAAMTINEGIAMSGSDYVNILNSDDLYEPDRIERMVEATAGAGAEWAFSGVSFIDAEGEPIDPLRDERVYTQTCMMASIPFRESVGFSLVTGNASVSSGNLFFSRRLCDRIGGFRDFRYNHDWDFGLRALREAEPVFVSPATYRYRLHGKNTITESGKRARGEANVMMTDFLDWAISGDIRQSPLAPSVANWGSTFITTVLEAGMANLVDPSLLRRLAGQAAEELSTAAAG